jgi:hypothetical protein
MRTLEEVRNEIDIREAIMFGEYDIVETHRQKSRILLRDEIIATLVEQTHILSGTLSDVLRRNEYMRKRLSDYDEYVLPYFD